LEFFVARQQYGRPFIAPPDTPMPVVAVYREAFVKLANDSQFRQEAAQQQAAIDLARGETVAAFVERLHATPKSILDRAIALTKSVGD
jgi:tripartite-type tricarboxylate transporter receptor subunit TctC